jgi:hypothetical protein
MHASTANFSLAEPLLSNPEALNIVSQDGKFPFDVAMGQKGGGDFMMELLGRKEKLQLVDDASRESDPEGYYSKCLLRYFSRTFHLCFLFLCDSFLIIRAKKQQIVEEQIYYLLLLSAFYITKSEKEVFSVNLRVMIRISFLRVMWRKNWPPLL